MKAEGHGFRYISLFFFPSSFSLKSDPGTIITTMFQGERQPQILSHTCKSLCVCITVYNIYIWVIYTHYTTIMCVYIIMYIMLYTQTFAYMYSFNVTKKWNDFAELRYNSKHIQGYSMYVKYLYTIHIFIYIAFLYSHKLYRLSM